MKHFLVLLAVTPSLGKGLFGQTKLYNFSTGMESFLVSGSIGAPLTHIFCWKEKPATLARFWESGLIEIDVAQNEDLKVHFNRNSEIVQEEAASQTVFWFHNSASQHNRKRIQMSPFRSDCIGVTTAETYHVTGHLLSVDKSLLALSILGFALFSTSNYLARLRPVAFLSSILLNLTLSCCLWSHWTQRNLRLSYTSGGEFWAAAIRTGALLTVSFLLYTSYQTGGSLSHSTSGQLNKSFSRHDWRLLYLQDISLFVSSYPC